MIESIKRLEKIARRLEPSPEQREHARASVLNYTENFLDHIYTLPAYVQSDEKGKGIYDSPISEQTVDIAAAIELFRKNVDSQGLNPASGGHLGYIPGGGIYYSSLGDYWADITNRYAGIYFAGPGAVRMENSLIRWAAELIGYPSDCAGNLASGGSIANLSAIVCAR